MPTMERAFRGTNQHQWELCQKFYFSIYGISKCPFIDFLCLCLPFYLTGSSVHCYCDVLAKLSTGGHYQLLKTKAGSINFDKKVLPSANNADVVRTGPFLASKWRRLLNWNSYLMFQQIVLIQQQKEDNFIKLLVDERLHFFSHVWHICTT